MAEKYDNQVYAQVRDGFAYIEDIPDAVAVVDMEENYLVFANSIFGEIFKIKKTPVSFGEISSYDVSSFVREIEITKANLISTNTEMVKLNAADGSKINADIKLKLVNRVKPNLAVMVVDRKIIKEKEANKAENSGNDSFRIDNSNLIKGIADGLPVLAYVYDIETTEMIYLNEYTKGFFKGSSNGEIIKKLDIHTNLSSSKESALIYEKSISGVWFKMTEITSLWERNRVVKIGVGINITEEKREEKKISIGAVTDELTGLYNKIVGFNRLQECIDRVKTEGSIFSLCYIDINKLNFVNDNYGVNEGNKYIKNVVGTVKKIIRRSDIFSRIGGDEFIIVLIDCPVLTAERIMKSINARLEELSMEERQLYDYAISYGIIEVNRNMDLKLDKLVQSAENEMCRYRFSPSKEI